MQIQATTIAADITITALLSALRDTNSETAQQLAEALHTLAQEARHQLPGDLGHAVSDRLTAYATASEIKKNGQDTLPRLPAKALH